MSLTAAHSYDAAARSREMFSFSHGPSQRPLKQAVGEVWSWYQLDLATRLLSGCRLRRLQARLQVRVALTEYGVVTCPLRARSEE